MSRVMYECEDGIDEAAWERAMDRLPPRRPRWVHRLVAVTYADSPPEWLREAERIRAEVDDD